MPDIGRDTGLAELAAIVSEALDAAGVVATLSGGAAVALYSDDRYQSEDLDFVTAALLDDLKPVLEGMGFVHTGGPRMSVFEHPHARWYLEFPPAPLAFGGTYVDAASCGELVTDAGRIRIVTPTQCLMDRSIAAASWHDAQSLEQAVLVAESQGGRIDWEGFDRWVVNEGIVQSRELEELYRRVGRALPPRSEQRA